MDHETRQFVTRKKKESWGVERKSSFCMKIENFDEFNLGETIESKKIHFLHGDEVWWMSLRKRYDKKTEFTFFLHASDFIWKSNVWSYSVAGTVNGSNICPLKTVFEITENPSSMIRLVNGHFSDILELKLTMTISKTSSGQLPSQMFICPIIQFKEILANNKELLNNSKYSDFKFVVHGKNFKVHKSILAAASPVFDKLFTTECRETVNNECIVNDIDPTIFQYLLNFIYCGELPEQGANNVYRALYEAAHYYQINKLAEICISVEEYHLSKENAVDVYQWTETYGVENLKKKAWKIIQFEILENLEADGPPPSFQSVQSLIECKIEKNKLLEEYRLQLSKLNDRVK